MWYPRALTNLKIHAFGVNNHYDLTDPIHINNTFYNRIINTMSYEPLAWNYNLVGGGNLVQWYTDARGKSKTVTFFSKGEYYTNFANYTIQNRKANGSMDWVFVYVNPNTDIVWVETMKMKKQK